METRDQKSAGSSRWFALILTSVMLLIWGAALRHAVLGGLVAGYVSHPAERPYPVDGVLNVCGFITGEFALLFAIIRPFSLSSNRRVLMALAVFVPLWIAEFFLISGWTDLAGYCYSNGFFLFLTVCFLTVIAVVSTILFRNRSQPNAA